MALSPDTECFECFKRGFSDFTARAGLPPEDCDRLIAMVNENLEKGLTPPVAGTESWALLRELSKTGSDIFAGEKKHFTKQMLLHYDRLKTTFLNSRNPESRALAAGTWCNLVDSGQGTPLPKIQDLVQTFSTPLTVDRSTEFLESLRQADTLLVLGDNAGETVIDRLFLDITSFRGNRYYMTRELPVMNDATVSDAEMAGLDLVAELVSSGIDVPAVIPEMLTGKAKQIYDSADIILAKGQGNLEGLFGLNDSRVYHSFVVKCPVVSRATGIPMGSGVFCRLAGTGGKIAYL
ncbi:MAG: DUF89 family protein [Candidatus Fermentibacteraceae bacterium]|nr:DUF89 family protein [Candidatus Fermentibacteraceae bacterium]